MRAGVSTIFLLLLSSPLLAQEGTVDAFVGRYCMRCHDAEKREGGVNLERLSQRFEPRLFKRIRTQLREQTMPPEDRRQPEPAEVEAFVAALDAQLRSERLDPGRVTLRRLNRAEYNNTVRDLFGVTLRPADAFPSDDTGYGFDTIGDVLSISPILLEKYLAAAEQVSERAVVLYRPLKQRRQAEQMRKSERVRSRGEFAYFTTNSQVSARFRIPHTGRYTLRARAYGQQAGPDAARMAFRVDGKRVKEVKVKAIQDGPKVYKARVQLTEGAHTIAVAFTNDYYKPKDPDPTQRDRNLAVDWVEVQGPAKAPEKPRFHGQVLADLERDVPQAIRALLLRAYRRPPTDAEVTRLVRLFEQVRAEGDPLERGLQVVIQAVLTSPQFLFRLERDPAAGQDARDLDEFELATRLSYFLWSSTPDDALLAEAQAKTLRKNLRAQVARLLDDPRAEALVANFAGQWLELRRLEEMTPDPRTFPSFDEPLRAAMVEETERFFEAVMRENRSVLDFLRARFTFVNARLAKHYGIKGVRGERFRRVLLPGERAGVLTHASVLTITSNPTRTSPVKRGKWVLEVLLDAPPPDPPPGADSIPEVNAEEAETSLRARLEAHRAKPECATCHAKLDPLGFGLEEFDGVGGFRKSDGPHAIDARGELPDGTSFQGPLGLRDYLLGRREEFVAALARKLLTYALGRGMRGEDEPAIQRVVRAATPSYRFHELVQRLVELDAFGRKGKP